MRTVCLTAILAFAAVGFDAPSQAEEAPAPVARLVCPGDCDSDGKVTVSELIAGIDWALGRPPRTPCEALDRDGDEAVSPHELVRAVDSALHGCLAAGFELVYEGARDGLPQLFVIALDGGEPRLLSPPGVVAREPAPSPDGARIAFVGVGDNEDPEIFRIDRNGSGLTRLTDDPEIDEQPAWSPDGTRIAFRSFRTLRDGDIWTMRPDGSDLRILTPDPLPGVTDERRPAWSPDGSRIAFASNLGGDRDLWVMDSDGGNMVRLTSTQDFDTEPAWSPDGEWIAFRRSNPELGSDIMLIRWTGGEPLRIGLAGEQRMPAWSPNGGWLALVSHLQPRDQPEVYLMRRDGSEMTLITRDPAWGGGLNPRFLPREPVR